LKFMITLQFKTELINSVIRCARNEGIAVPMQIFDFVSPVTASGRSDARMSLLVAFCLGLEVLLSHVRVG
jgi:hypothetical protein